MHFLSFRNRSLLRRILLILLISAMVLVLVAMGLFIYLQRYLVYGKQGVYLDFSRPPIAEQEQKNTTSPPTFPATQFIQSEGSDNDATANSELLSGYIVPLSLLQQPELLLRTCEAMDTPCTLLFDLKDSVGNFYYTSSVVDQGENSQDLLSSVLEQLQSSGFHLVARISALRDRSYGLQNPDCGLPLASGVLWMDAGGCYWLDPANDTVQVRLIRICTELFQLGFSEVVLNNFYFPESDQIVYSSDDTPQAALSSAAQRIRDALEDKGLVSIQLQQDQALLDPGAGRLYCATDDARQVQNLLDAAGSRLTNPSFQLVFLTDSRDTRFEGYGLLRNLEIS